MFKKISLFAIAFAVVGLTACAEGDDTTVIDEPAEVETPVEVMPADEMMEEGDAMMEEGETMIEEGAEEVTEEVEEGTEAPIE